MKSKPFGKSFQGVAYTVYLQPPQTMLFSFLHHVCLVPTVLCVGGSGEGRRGGVAAGGTRGGAGWGGRGGVAGSIPNDKPIQPGGHMHHDKRERRGGGDTGEINGPSSLYRRPNGPCQTVKKTAVNLPRFNDPASI